MTTEPEDLRETERFLVTEKLVGSFGAAQVVLLDVAEQGVQIEHSHPLRLATKGRLWFKHHDTIVSLHAFVVWSRLSKSPNEQGKYLYHSGLRIDERVSEYLAAIRTLSEHGVIRSDDDSLARKRRREEERDLQRSGKPVVKHVATESDISLDQVLLIQHARERLRSNFDEAQKWYSRAYFALRDGRTGANAEPTRYPEDVLAIWEYLERSVPLPIIQRIIDQVEGRNR